MSCTRWFGSVSLIVMGLALASGCRGSGDDPKNPDSGLPPDSQVVTGCDQGHTIQQVQDVSMPVGTSVALCGVVVTAIDTFGERVGNVYVMEPEGGPYSGVLIYLTSASASAGLEVGDIINVLGGVKDEFALNTDTSGRTLTEIVAPAGGAIELVKVGTGTVPVPELLDPRVLAASSEEAEKWASVLIKFENVAVNRAPNGATDRSNMMVTGPFEVGASLTLLDSQAIQRQDCFAEIVGVADYFFDYKILPRSAEDLVAGGTDCPEPEEGEEACSDGIDNDYDGFIDCVDFSCQETVPACTSETTVVDLQNGTIETNTQITVTGVVVTALDRNRRHLWVMDAADPAPYNGIYVYRGAQAEELPLDIEVGAVVNVSGRVIEFQTLTEIADANVTFTGNLLEAEALAGVSPSVLADDDEGEPYEGVLVKLENVRVIGANVDQYMSFTVGEAATPLRVGNYIHEYESPQAGDCYASLVGVMHRFSSTGISLLPRGAEDMVSGEGCD